MKALQIIGGNVIAAVYHCAQDEAEEHYRRTCGLPFFQQLEQLYPGNPHNKAAAEAFERTKAAQYHQAQPFPETVDFLRALQAQGIFVAISSNNFQRLVEERVEQIQLPVDMVCGFHAGEGKGAAHFARVAEECQAMRHEMIFVGDSLHDAQLAADYGIDFLGRCGTFRAEEFSHMDPHTTVIHNFRELLG